MLNIQLAKEELLSVIKKYQAKKEKADDLKPDYYEPGEMENLAQYLGVYDEGNNTITVQTDAKGLRYDERTPRLDYLSVGDPVQIVREPNNPYNENNLMILSKQGESLGNLSAELCNVLAPLIDLGYAVIKEPTICYLEKLKDRSRYAKQGVLFVKMDIVLLGI